MLAIEILHIEGEARGLASDPRVKKAYLGG